MTMPPNFPFIPFSLPPAPLCQEVLTDLFRTRRPASAVSDSFPLFDGQHSPQPYSPSPHSHAQIAYTPLPHPYSSLAAHPPHLPRNAPNSLAAYPQYGTPPHSTSGFAHSPHRSSFAHSPHSHAGSVSSNQHSPAPIGMRLEHLQAGDGSYNPQGRYTPELFEQQARQLEQPGGRALATPAPQYAFDHHLARVLDANVSPMPNRMDGLNGMDEQRVKEEARSPLVTYKEMDVDADALFDGSFQASPTVTSISGLDRGGMNSNATGGMGTTSEGSVKGWVEPPSMPPVSSSAASSVHTISSLPSASSIHVLSSFSASSPSRRLSVAHTLYSPSPSDSPNGLAAPTSLTRTIAAATSGGEPILSLRVPESQTRARTRTHSGAGAVDTAATLLPTPGSALSIASFAEGEESMPPSSPLSDGGGSSFANDFSSSKFSASGLGRTLSEDGGMTSPALRGAGATRAIMRARAATVSVPSAIVGSPR
ncbi:hypothetical protein B0H12DRAFT_54086 [Mycena haematopus]|nr:hypothetical protein B0H12DRAFT_54086 [Mycena haematopus]